MSQGEPLCCAHGYRWGRITSLAGVGPQIVRVLDLHNVVARSRGRSEGSNTSDRLVTNMRCRSIYHSEAALPLSPL